MMIVDVATSANLLILFFVFGACAPGVPMTTYVANAFSLSMVSGICPAEISVVEVEAHAVKKILKGGFVSCIGHADTANIVSRLLSMEIPHDKARTSIALKEDDKLVVAQYSGSRLTEGATTLPEGAKIAFYWITARCVN